MHVAALLKRKGADVITASPQTPVSEVAAVLARHRIGALVIADGDGLPVGILSERDIVRAIATEGAACLDGRAGDLMTRNLVTGAPTDTVAKMMAVMSERRIRHVPILENGRMVGIVSIGDVVKARLDEAEMEMDSLRGFVAGIG